MKIMHITESLAAGVREYLRMCIQGQVAVGHEVVLVHSIRQDTVVDELDAQFGFVSQRHMINMVTEVSIIQDLRSLVLLWRLLRTQNPDVLHLHSSKAGVLGRIAAILAGCPTKVFYSPHGFAFLRQDVSQSKQALYLWFERLAALLGGTLVACSLTEAELAQSRVRHECVRLIENATDLSEVRLSKGSSDNYVNVLNSGRACFQKAPWRFKMIADLCADLSARFVWMGDGDLSHMLHSNEAPYIQLTGWQSRAEVLLRLTQTDVFLMTSLWEGMPLALIEAQAAGIPAVVSNVVGCRDVVQDGVTGFVCDTDDDLRARTRQLIEDAKLRKCMGENAWRIARTRFAVTRMNDELLRLYGSCT